METFLQQLINGLQLGAVYALIALGYTMVYGVVKLINFAHGDVYMVGAYVAFAVATQLAVGNTTAAGLAIFALAMVAAMAACAALGVVIERVAYRPLRGQPRLVVLTTAIGVSLLLENLVQIIAGPNPRPFPKNLIPARQWDLGSVVVDSKFLVAFVVSVVMMIGLQYLVMNTKLGKAMRAVAFDMDAARLMGVDVNRVIAYTFMIGSALAAVAGVLVGIAYNRIDPFMGILPGLKAFVAAVLGGIGNIPGAMVGGLIMGLCEVAVSSNYSQLTGAVAFVILIAVLLFKPTGLLGERVYDKV